MWRRMAANWTRLKRKEEEAIRRWDDGHEPKPSEACKMRETGGDRERDCFTGVGIEIDAKKAAAELEAALKIE